MAKSIHILLLILFISGAIIAGPESAGLSFLKLPAAAHSAAVMGVFAPIENNPTALFENPLGIHTQTPQGCVSHHAWFADVTNDVLAFNFPIKSGTLGTGLNLVRIPGIEVRDMPSDEPLNNIEAQYLAAALGYTHNFFKQIQLGLTLKYLYESLYIHDSHGIGLDLAAMWRAPSSLNISFMIQNIGKMNPLHQEAAQLPTTLQIGIIRPQIFTEGPLGVSIGINLESHLTTGDAGAQIGTEVRLYKHFTLRAGYERVGNIDRKALGFGLSLDRFGFDYGLVIMPEGLPYPHLFSLTYRFRK